MKKTNKRMKLKEFIEEAEKSEAYWSAITMHHFTEEISSLLEKKGITRKELASAIGTTPAYVTKILKGSENVSINTMTKFAMAFNSIVHVHIADKDTFVEWKEMPSTSAVYQLDFSESDFPADQVVTFVCVDPQEILIESKIAFGTLSTVNAQEWVH